MEKGIRNYLLITFGFTWLFWGTVAALTQFHIMEFRTPLVIALYVLGGNMPPISAIYLRKKYESREEFHAHLKNIINFIYSIGWYILIIVISFLLCFIMMLLGGAVQQAPVYMAFLLFPLMIFGGGLEEIGWRGFLQPALQKRFSHLVSTIIISVLWAAWHIPLWFIPGVSQYGTNYLCFAVTVAANAFILAAIYNAAGSVFLCIITHAFTNAFCGVYVFSGKLIPSFIILFFGITFFIIIEQFSKKKLNPVDETEK